MFDTLGGEVYTYYHFDNGLRPTLNYNLMKDRSDETKGYKRNLIIPGLEYHFKRTYSLFGQNISSILVKIDTMVANSKTVITSLRLGFVTISDIKSRS